MNAPPQSGLPPKIYVPIVLTVGVVVLAIVGYFLKSALTTSGGALAPEAQASAQATIPSTQATMPTAEVSVPQSGGAPAEGESAPTQGGDASSQGGAASSQVGAASTQGGGPPPVVAQMLGDLRARLQRNPNDLAALIGLGSLYFDAGKFAGAIPYYRRALAIDPANPDSRTDYATALHGTGSDLEALTQLQRVLAAHPDFAPALFNEGIVAGAIGRRTQAIAAFRHFLAVAPHDQKASDAKTALQNLGAG